MTICVISTRDDEGVRAFIRSATLARSELDFRRDPAGCVRARGNATLWTCSTLAVGVERLLFAFGEDRMRTIEIFLGGLVAASLAFGHDARACGGCLQP